MHGFTHGRGLLQHLTPLLGVQNHRFVDARRRGLAPGLPRHGRIAAGIHFDDVLPDVNFVSVMQSGALDAQIVDECAVKAVEILNDHSPRLEVNLRVVTGDG